MVSPSFESYGCGSLTPTLFSRHNISQRAHRELPIDHLPIPRVLRLPDTHPYCRNGHPIRSHL